MDATENLVIMPDRPGELLPPDGLVGEVARWIVDSAGCYQPNFALAAALTACGALVGRGVKDYTGQRSNIYALAVGETSCGKNEPLKCIDALFRALHFEKLLQGEVTSDSALEVLLTAHPVRLLKIDELGHYLKNIKGAGQSNGHLKTVMPMLTKAWSAAGGVLEGKTRAEAPNEKTWKPGRHIDEPCLCMYGTTVPGVLFDSLDASDIADGSIPRFLLFRSDTIPRRKTKPEISVPDELRNRIADALNHLGIPKPGAKSQDGKPADIPTPMLVSETKEAAQTFEGLEDVKYSHTANTSESEIVRQIWGKAVENSRRVALIVAAFRNPSAPVIEEYDARYAVQLVQWLVSNFAVAVTERVSSTRTERTKKRILRLLQRAGEEGLTKTQLTHATQDLDGRERAAAVVDLVDGGEVVMEEVKTSRKSTMVARINPINPNKSASIY